MNAPSAAGQAAKRIRKNKDVPWPWNERSIGFSETCWVGSSL